MSNTILPSPPIHKRRSKPIVKAKAKPATPATPRKAPAKVKPRPEPRPGHSGERTVKRAATRAKVKKVAKAVKVVLKKALAIAATVAPAPAAPAPAILTAPPAHRQKVFVKRKDSASPSLVAECGVDAVVNKYFPALLEVLHAALAVVGAMSLKGRSRPLSVMFESGSGAGKTTVLQMFFPIRGTDTGEFVADYIYRSDKFSPRSFVSHAANIEARKMKNVDLLPKLKGKVFIVKEMSTIFRGREAELTEIFSILCSVLDGEGLVSDSGVHGGRGYDDQHLFNWLGATTPLPPLTHRLMAQLGTRLLFYEVPHIEITEMALIEYAKRESAGTSAMECRQIVNQFLVGYFAAYPVASVEQGSITFTEAQLAALVRWASFIAAGRAVVKYEKSDGTNWKPVAVLPAEAPFKVVDYLKDLARGHALIHGRDRIEQCDIDLVAKVAVSSIPGHLRKLVSHLRKNESCETAKAAALCEVSRRFVLNYLVELEMLGIAELTKGKQDQSLPDAIRLAEKYKWLKTQTSYQ
jgi:hypothetical protein